jgi:hypothetical protein
MVSVAKVLGHHGYCVVSMRRLAAETLSWSYQVARIVLFMAVERAYIENGSFSGFLNPRHYFGMTGLSLGLLEN